MNLVRAGCRMPGDEPASEILGAASAVEGRSLVGLRSAKETVDATERQPFCLDGTEDCEGPYCGRHVVPFEAFCSWKVIVRIVRKLLTLVQLHPDPDTKITFSPIVSDPGHQKGLGHPLKQLRYCRTSSFRNVTCAAECSVAKGIAGFESDYARVGQAP